MQALLKLAPYFRSYRWYMVIVIVSAGAITALNLANPWLVRELVSIIRTETGDAATNRVVNLGLILIVIFIARAIARYMYLYLAHIMAYSFVGDLRVILYTHLQRLSSRFFADRQTGEILKRVINDTREVEPFLAHYIPDMTVNLLLLVGVGVILFNLNPTLALLTLLPIPALFLSNALFGKRMRTALKEASSYLGSLTGMVQDNLVGIKEIQLFTQEKREYVRVNSASGKATRSLLYGLKMQAILAPSIELLTAFGLVIVVIFGGQAALNGTMNVEDLVAFVLYLNIFYQPITLIAQMNEMLHNAITGAEHVVEVLDIQPDVDDAPHAKDPGRLRGEIVFHQVDFEYNENIPTLNDISLEIHPGQTLALVGTTGAGKTTVASLVPRFYDVSGGSVTIDGMDVREMTVQGLRANISMVMQDVFLFNGTIRDNIHYSNLNATDDDLMRAAKAARAHDFIMAMPEGYDTIVGERGVKLSGGQKQRLAIARAVLKDAPILILDEATSAVDTETEAEIQEALNELMKGRTSIVIAHRLSTIRQANQIIVLDAGRIVEKGQHHELIFGQGRYQRLHEMHNRMN